MRKIVLFLAIVAAVLLVVPAVSLAVEPLATGKGPYLGLTADWLNVDVGEDRSKTKFQEYGLGLGFEDRDSDVSFHLAIGLVTAKSDDFFRLELEDSSTGSRDLFEDDFENDGVFVRIEANYRFYKNPSFFDVGIFGSIEAISDLEDEGFDDRRRGRDDNILDDSNSGSGSGDIIIVDVIDLDFRSRIENLVIAKAGFIGQKDLGRFSIYAGPLYRWVDGKMVDELELDGARFSDDDDFGDNRLGLFAGVAARLGEKSSVRASYETPGDQLGLALRLGF